MASRIRSRDYAALAEIRYRIRCFLVFSEASARAADVEPQQHQLLLAVRGLPSGVPPTIGNVADRLQLQHNSTVELVNRSCEKGLVVKRPSPSDRRQVHLEITPQGERLLEKLAVAHRTELRRAAPALLEALTALVQDEKVSSK